MPHRNLAVELLQKLLNNEIRSQSARNVVQSKAFSEKLAAAMRAYENRTGGASKSVRPPFRDVGGGHFIACHLSDDDRRTIWETEIRPNL